MGRKLIIQLYSYFVREPDNLFTVNHFGMRRLRLVQRLKRMWAKHTTIEKCRIG